jgi:hypothetical protein
MSAPGAFAVIAILAVFAAPIFIVGYIMLRRKRRLDQETREPFTELPLRPPGESLRLKLEKLSEDFEETLTFGFGIGSISALVVIFAPAQVRTVVLAVVGTSAAIGYLWFGRKLLRLQREFWRNRLGYMGERAVGEELNQLLAAGFRVFHDVPFERFNIDHVLVGPQGVFAVETKARRKRVPEAGKVDAKVKVNGDVLHFSHWRDSTSIDQVRLGADALGRWLTKATGEPVRAGAILALPGWYVEGLANGVQVLNPKQVRGFLSGFKPILEVSQIDRIAYQLTERCRLQPKT